MILLLGCTENTGEPSALPMAYVPEDPGPAEVSFSAEQAATALDEVLARLTALDARPVFAAYDEMIPWADELCPGPVVSEDGSSLWDTDGCTSSSGATFAGFVSSFEDPLGSGSRSMNAEASIGAPDGRQLVVAGTAQLVLAGGPHTSEVAAVVRYDGPAAEGTWIQDELDLSLALAWTEGASGMTRVDAEGGIGVQLGPIMGVDFVGFSASTERVCPEEPAGRVGLRDPSGAWAEVTFDVTGNEADGWEVTTCDGCGVLRAGEVDLGVVCVDTAPLFEARP